MGNGNDSAMKPTIMILGCEHLANPGADTFNTRMDNVLAPKRQAEIQQIVQRLKGFSPTKIALEIAAQRFDAEVQTNYQGYLNGTYALKRGEGDQIGFRLAKQFGHRKVYCVDYFPAHDPFWPEDVDLVDAEKFAKANNQEHLLYSLSATEGKIVQDADGTTWIEREKYESLLDMCRRLNQPDALLAGHQQYLKEARVGLRAQYPGANWLAHVWYARNLKIFVNLTRITESTDDRILLIIGAGHVYLVQQFLEDSGDYIVESPLKYLGASESE